MRIMQIEKIKKDLKLKKMSMRNKIKRMKKKKEAN